MTTTASTLLLIQLFTLHDIIQQRGDNCHQPGRADIIFISALANSAGNSTMINFYLFIYYATYSIKVQLLLSKKNFEKFNLSGSPSIKYSILFVTSHHKKKINKKIQLTVQLSSRSHVGFPQLLYRALHKHRSDRYQQRTDQKPALLVACKKHSFLNI